MSDFDLDFMNSEFSCDKSGFLMEEKHERKQITTYTTY